jgi:hypothetical protein
MSDYLESIHHDTTDCIYVKKNGKVRGYEYIIISKERYRPI